MTYTAIFSLLAVTALTLCQGAAASPSDSLGNFAQGDVMADTWVATDGLGRKLPTFQDVGPPRENRNIGLFYFLWVNSKVTNPQGRPIYDVERLTQENPENPAWGPPGAFHFWAEPELGYYSIEDPYVLIKHRSLLTAAGVDFLFLDQTNALIYPEQAEALMKCLDAGRLQGLPVPKIAGIHNSRSHQSVPKWFDAVYRKNLYPELWFHWLGKPLLLSPREGLSPEILDFFTIRHTWAWSCEPWFDAGRDKWTWIDWGPQQPGWHEAPKVPEQISVCNAPHPIHGKGRSSTGNERKPPPPTAAQFRTAEGIYAAGQWKRALEVDPPVVLVTGWNEWIAQRFINGKPHFHKFLGLKKLALGDTVFIDQYNQEFSRDAEPMKGGHGDAYYYQLVSNIRRYKGVRPPEIPVSRPITRDGNVDDWSEVRPVFRDFTGDAIHRDHSGFHAPTRYTSNLGRNDIALAQVSLSEKVIHFRVSCASPIQTEKTGDWLTLWIDLDQDGSTGFMGYEVVIHRTAATATHLSAQRFKDGAWVDLAPVPYVKLAEHLELSLPRAWLASGSEVKFDFKWADAFAGNFQSEGFYTCGDAAPERRFNYRYDSSISAEKIESWRTAHAARTR